MCVAQEVVPWLANRLPSQFFMKLGEDRAAWANEEPIKS